MNFSLEQLKELIKESLCERQWNKENGRDYSKEYNKPGSPEQEDRNTRKRHKRKHDKEHGECSDGEELHHTNGLEEDDVSCEPISKNRGRKEKSRLKDDETVMKIGESNLRKIIKEESDIVLKEFFSALAGAAATKAAEKIGSMAGNAAVDSVFGDDEDEQKPETDKKLANINISSYEDLASALNSLFKKSGKKGLSGDYKAVAQALKTAPEMIKHLKR